MVSIFVAHADAVVSETRLDPCVHPGSHNPLPHSHIERLRRRVPGVVGVVDEGPAEQGDLPHLSQRRLRQMQHVRGHEIVDPAGEGGEGLPGRGPDGN